MRRDLCTKLTQSDCLTGSTNVTSDIDLDFLKVNMNNGYGQAVAITWPGREQDVSRICQGYA